MDRGHLVYGRPESNIPDRDHLCSIKQLPSSGNSTGYHAKNLPIGDPGSQPLKLDKPRPHVCKTCSRPFVRLEHLQRHERLHTKEKPFECQTCMRRFARKDLMLRHKRKLHVTSPTPPQLGGDPKESATPRLILCDTVCERFIDHDVNSALSMKLTRAVALDAEIIRHIDSSNCGLIKLADSHSSFWTVEGLENQTRYGHKESTSSAWNPVYPGGSQTLTTTDRWGNFPGLSENGEQTSYDSTISSSLDEPQAIDRVIGSNTGDLSDYGTDKNTAKLYLDGNASACENASTLQSWTPESMQPWCDEHNDCRWTTEWKSRQPYEHGSIAYGDTTVSTWSNSPCSWETLLAQHSSQTSLLQVQPSCLHPCGLAASVHAILPNQPNGQENAMDYYFDEIMMLRDILWCYPPITCPMPLGARRKA